MTTEFWEFQKNEEKNNNNEKDAFQDLCMPLQTGCKRRLPEHCVLSQQN